MAFKVIWSRFAVRQLDEIYEYFKNKASLSIANKLITAIINETDKLIDAPMIGQKEPLLASRSIEYRYLVFNNYKLIYSINEENQQIRIADVFDTRQNPPKIKRNK